mmetsp:Transcript_87692/g.225963  ORF Transcript_87692/g.225963 Transcript_87692/m.225963 type:complete len:248 (+) Transcript_87692:1068-1811(+)
MIYRPLFKMRTVFCPKVSWQNSSEATRFRHSSLGLSSMSMYARCTASSSSIRIVLLMPHSDEAASSLRPALRCFFGSSVKTSRESTPSLPQFFLFRATSLTSSIHVRDRSSMTGMMSSTLLLAGRSRPVPKRMRPHFSCVTSSFRSSASSSARARSSNVMLPTRRSGAASRMRLQQPPLSAKTRICSFAGAGGNSSSACMGSPARKVAVELRSLLSSGHASGYHSQTKHISLDTGSRQSCTVSSKCR